MQRSHPALPPTERIKDAKSRSAAGRWSYPAALANSQKDSHTACAPPVSWGWAGWKTLLTSGQSAVATGGPSGASHAWTEGGAGRGGSAGAVYPRSGGRSSGTLAGPPPGAGTEPDTMTGAGDVAASAPGPATATAPAGRGGFRHSRPFGSYGSRMPGGTDGRTGTVGRRPGGPDVVGATDADTCPGAVAAVDGHDGGAGDGAPTGPAGGVAGNGSISAEGDVVLRGPLCARGPPRGRRRGRGARYSRGGGDASGGGGRRGGDAGTGARGRPRCPARATRGAYPTRRARHAGPAEGRIGAPERVLARPRGRGR